MRNKFCNILKIGNRIKLYNYITTHELAVGKFESSAPLTNASSLWHLRQDQITRHFSTLKGAETVQSVRESPNNILHVKFGDNSEGAAPYLWLRDNCQCHDCFDPVALARKFLIEDLKTDIKPTKVTCDGELLSIAWNDSHVSKYSSDWLYRRIFNSPVREGHDKFQISKKLWGKGFEIKKYNYDDLVNDDNKLLEWLVTMEEDGASLVKNSPNDPDAAGKFSDHIGFVRRTHYGRTSGVYNRDDSYNLAFKNIKLGLHVDLPFYDYQPGLILLHTVEQHKDVGGESICSDGFYCAEYLKRHHPKEYEFLTTHNVYFWDKGEASKEMEKGFFKTFKHPIICLDKENNIKEIRLNNQVRDSFLEVDVESVNEFYKAMKLFYQILHENCIKFKMERGDIIILDNLRCLHGREAFHTKSERHLETSYIDWDEIRCKRRRIIDKMENSK